MYNNCTYGTHITLTQTIYCKLNPEQLLHFTEILVTGVLDCESGCSLGTARMLQDIFTEVGAQFQRQTLDIFSEHVEFVTFFALSFNVIFND